MLFSSSAQRLKKYADSDKKKRAKTRLQMESLEPRSMLSASLGANAIVQPNSQGEIVSLSSTGSISVYTPAQIRAAYGFTGLSETGAGQTIAIVDAYGDSTISADLHAFDQQFGLADPKLSVVNETGGTKLPGNNSGWDMEISLDVEWAHAIAPGANILLVEASSSSLGDLLTAVNTARNTAGVSVVSMSWGTSDFSGEAAYNSYFTTPAGHTPVTFVASSGDSGAGASWPAIANNVLAVGGTTLKLTASNGYSSETAWSGSGGGYSSNETESSYLTGMQSTGKQSDPDVSYDADPNTGFFVREGGNWYDVGGTSAGAPQWSALIALANQGRASAGKAALSNADQSIMSLSSSDFHDVTSGSNGAYKATVGYDVVTGRGTPVANLVVNGLIAANNPTATVSGVTITVVQKTATNSADGGSAVGATGPSGSDGGGSSMVAAATSSGNTSSTITGVSSDSGANSVGPKSSPLTADALAPTVAATSDSPFADADSQDTSADASALSLGGPAANNLDAQFEIAMDAFTTHSNDAVEGLLGSLLANRGSGAAG